MLKILVPFWKFPLILQLSTRHERIWVWNLNFKPKSFQMFSSFQSRGDYFTSRFPLSVLLELIEQIYKININSQKKFSPNVIAVLRFLSTFDADADLNVNSVALLRELEDIRSFKQQLRTSPWLLWIALRRKSIHNSTHAYNDKCHYVYSRDERRYVPRNLYRTWWTTRYQVLRRDSRELLSCRTIMSFRLT